MNNLRAALTLTFNDKLSDGLKRLTDRMTNLKEIGKGLTLGALASGGGIIDRIRSGIDRMTSSIGRATQGFRTMEAAASRAWAKAEKWGKDTFGKQSKAGGFAAAAEGLSVAAPIRAYADYENVLRHIAITKGLSGPAVEQEVGRLNLKFAHEARETGQSSHSIAVAFQDLIQSGLSYDTAEHLIGAHSRAATAYNISPEALGHAVFALSDSFKIGHEEMPLALSAMAQAAKEGRFKVEDFSRFLPMIGGQMALMGMTGREGANTAFAALETIAKNSADPSSTATNYFDALRYITSPAAAHAFAMKGHQVPEEVKAMMKEATGSFADAGINLPKLLIDKGKEGINPLDAVMGEMSKLVKGKSFAESSVLLGNLLHNQQAGIAIASLLAHKEEFEEKRHRYGQVDQTIVQRDFNSARRAPLIEVKLFEEMLGQLTRRLGQSFAPMLLLLNNGLDRTLHFVEALDARFPGLVDTVLLVAGSFLAFAAAVAAIGFIWPPLVTGFTLFAGIAKMVFGAVRLLGTGLMWLVGALAGLLGVTTGVAVAIVAVAAVLIAAAVDIVRNWDRFSSFFSDMWAGIKDIFGGFLDFLVGVFWNDTDRTTAALMRVWRGVKKFFGGLWDTIKALFLDFTGWVDEWTGGAATAAIGGIKSAWSGLMEFFTHLWAEIRKPFDKLVEDFNKSPFGAAVGALKTSSATAAEGADAEAGAMPWARQQQGPSEVQITVRAEEGTSAKVDRTDPGVTVRHSPLDRGRTLNRP